MVSTDASPTPYDRIGGSEAVNQAVDILYEKLFGDGNCRQFFERTDMRKLKAHQARQLALSQDVFNDEKFCCLHA